MSNTEYGDGLSVLLDEVSAAAVDFAAYKERDEMCASAYDAAQSRVFAARRAVFAHKIEPPDSRLRALIAAWRNDAVGYSGPQDLSRCAHDLELALTPVTAS